MAEFDREWESVLDRAKQDKTLEPVHSMLHKWRHLAHAEQQDPGAYFRLLARVEWGLRTGRTPEGSVPGDTVKAQINRRLGRPA